MRRATTAYNYILICLKQDSDASTSKKFPAAGTFWQRIRGYAGRFLPIALAAAFTAWDLFPAFLGSTEIRMVEKKAPKRGRRPVGDRRPFLTMMSPSVIKAVQHGGREGD